MFLVVHALLLFVLILTLLSLLSIILSTSTYDHRNTPKHTSAGAHTFLWFYLRPSYHIA